MITRTYNLIEPGRAALWLYGHIGDNVRLPTFLRALREYPDGDGPIDLFIQSEGGQFDVGMSLYALLRDTPRPKRVTIVSARSMAAVVAMAGDEIRMVEGGDIFLHQPHYAVPTILNVAAKRDLTGQVLRGLASSCDDAEHAIIEVLARRCRLSRSMIAALMGLETTLDAARAVEIGLVDEIVNPWGAP